MQDKISSYIALQGACNARDLGGYETKDGLTARYAFFRCESPAGLTEADISLLLGLGLAAVIDLRGRPEIEREPGPFIDLDEVQWHNFPLFDGNLPPHVRETGNMGDFYIHMLESAGNGFAAIFRAILAARGGVLFHCSAGKDRTGLVAALLLLNAGVAREMVITEYCYTDALLGAWVEAQTKLAESRGHALNTRLLEANRAYIETALDHLDCRYGGADGYLAAIGLTEDERAALRTRVLGGV